MKKILLKFKTIFKGVTIVALLTFIMTFLYYMGFFEKSLPPQVDTDYVPVDDYPNMMTVWKMISSESEYLRRFLKEQSCDKNNLLVLQDYIYDNIPVYSLTLVNANINLSESLYNENVIGIAKIDITSNLSNPITSFSIGCCNITWKDDSEIEYSIKADKQKYHVKFNGSIIFTLQNIYQNPNRKLCDISDPNKINSTNYYMASNYEKSVFIVIFYTEKYEYEFKIIVKMNSLIPIIDIEKI